MDKRQQMFEDWAVDNGFDDLRKKGNIYEDDATEAAYYGFLGALSVVRNFAWGAE